MRSRTHAHCSAVTHIYSRADGYGDANPYTNSSAHANSRTHGYGNSGSNCDSRAY